MEPLNKLILSRQETDNSWLVQRSDLDENLNLDIKNPRRKLHSLADRGDLEVLSAQMRSFADEADAVKAELAKITQLIRQSPWELLGHHTFESDERVGEDYTPEMPLLGVSAEEGITNPKTAIGKSPERYKVLRIHYLAYNPMRINIGSIGVVRDETQQGITSPDYVVFYCGPDLLPEYVYHYLRSETGRHEIHLKTKGSVRFRLYFEQLAKITLPIPKELEVQQRFVNACNRLEALKRMLSAAASAATDCLNAATRSGFLHESGKSSNNSTADRAA
jgi:hypothetical protein